ncbi:MFS transporter [Actinomadura sp. K4S16]|uniref:MFS transporter n=1 Tax=Actinomadura sp. K4S16 TaxID=1316147 RepID=UPI0011EDD531|nr:MFS transporter [Actinomadura sp. K4S16]
MSRGIPAPVPSADTSAAGTAASRVPLLALCVTEITSWGVLYYAFPVLAQAVTRDTGWSIAAITAAFSASLIAAAPGGIPVGRALGRHGPRVLMTGGSVLAVLAVLAVAAAPNLWAFAAAWLLAGVAMYAVVINLIPLLTSRGAASATAAWALGLGGIGQVTGRLGYRTLVHRTSVRARTVWILALSAATTAALAVIPGPVALLIAVAFPAGTTHGIAALLQATAVSDRWGTASYGALSGILAAPITVATAPAPTTARHRSAALPARPAARLAPRKDEE